MATKRIKGLYKLLETIKSLKGKTFLMICELIDNSISSWVDDGKNKNIVGLKITVNADFRSFNSAEHIISVTDNAFGMNEKELEQALTIAFINPKPSGLGIFGMGLKQAAFWMGRKLEIYTKSIDGSCLNAILDLDQISKTENDEDATYEISNMPAELYERGTNVLIQNINVGVERSKLFYIDTLKKILGWKYNRYLSNGLEITINYLKDNSSIDVEKFMPQRENITQWATDNGKDVELTKKEIISLLEEGLKNNNLKKEIIKHIETDKPLLFDIPLKFSGIDSKMTYGILGIAHSGGKGLYKGLAYTKVNGISVYQALRAVICGPNTDDNSTFHRERSDAGSGEIYKIRLFGTLIVDPYVKAKIVNLDTNKSSLKWEDTDFKKYIESRLKQYRDNGLGKAVEIIGKYQNKQQPNYKGPNPKGVKKIQEIIVQKWKQFATATFQVLEEEVETREGGTVRPLLIENIKIGDAINNIMLVEEMGGDQSFIFSELQGDTLITRINIEHKLWSPNMETKTDEIKRTIIYPLSIMIGIAQYVMTSDDIQDKTDFEALMLYADELIQE